MKKTLLLLSTLLIATITFGQAKLFCLAPSCKQTANVGDSVTIFAQLTASDGFGSISWKQTGGPGTAMTAPVVAAGTGSVTQSSFKVKPTADGTYIFTATGASLTGTTTSVADTLVVNLVAKRIAYVLTVYSDSTRIKNQ